MLKGDAQAVSQYLDDDLIYVHSNGLVDTKESYIKSLSDGRYVYESIEVVDEHSAQGADFVVLCQILSVDIRVGTENATERRLVAASSVWKQSQGRWRLVAMQSTPRTAAAPLAVRIGAELDPSNSARREARA